MADSVTTIINKDEVQNWIEQIISELPDQTGNLVLDILNLLSSIAEVLAPFRLGNLRDSHVITVSGLIGDLGNTASYFPYIILGTAPHSIGSSILINGEWRYIGLSPTGAGKMHPGTAPNDYMADTLDSGDGSIDDLANNFLEWMVT